MSIDDYNYYNDRRVQAANTPSWFSSFDESTMTAEVEVEDENGEMYLETLPVKFEVCDTCDGRGSHVNPSIDSGGLTSDDFYDDPDFEEDYHSGRYDVTCYSCGGKRVLPVINHSYLNEAQKKAVEYIEDCARYEAEYQAQCRMERIMGC